MKIAIAITMLAGLQHAAYAFNECSLSAKDYDSFQSTVYLWQGQKLLGQRKSAQLSQLLDMAQEKIKERQCMPSTSGECYYRDFPLNEREIGLRTDGVEQLYGSYKKNTAVGLLNKIFSLGLCSKIVQLL